VSLWIGVISGALAVVAIMYATGQVKTHVRRRWFVIGVTLLIALIAILVFPRWAEGEDHKTGMQSALGLLDW